MTIAKRQNVKVRSTTSATSSTADMMYFGRGRSKLESSADDASESGDTG
jgi:hypothetical protein